MVSRHKPSIRKDVGVGKLKNHTGNFGRQPKQGS